MSRLLEDHRHFQYLFRVAKEDQRKALHKTVDKSQLKALCEIAHNAIKETIVWTAEEELRLKRFRKIIYVLGKKSSNRKERPCLTKSGRCRRSPVRYRRDMEKMIQVSSEIYQKFLSEQKRKQTGEGTKKRKLGPPGIPVKDKQIWISL